MKGLNSRHQQTILFYPKSVWWFLWSADWFNAVSFLYQKQLVKRPQFRPGSWVQFDFNPPRKRRLWRPPFSWGIDESIHRLPLRLSKFFRPCEWSAVFKELEAVHNQQTILIFLFSLFFVQDFYILCRISIFYAGFLIRPPCLQPGPVWISGLIFGSEFSVWSVLFPGWIQTGRST